MTLSLIPDGVLARDSYFDSEADVQAADPVAPGCNFISVMETGRQVIYKRTTGATELIGGDGSTWQSVNITIDDLTSLAGDMTALYTAIPQASGVWYPAMRWSDLNGSFSSTDYEGRFVRFGPLMYVQANMTFTVDSGGTGTLQLSGLPYATRAGSFISTLNITWDETAFQTPHGGIGWRVRLAGGQTAGPLTFDAGANLAKVYVIGLTGTTPVGDGSAITLSGSPATTAQILSFEMEPGETAKGFMTISNRYVALANGMTISGSTNGTAWQATLTVGANTPIWYGADAGTSFYTSAQVKRNSAVTLELDGFYII